jgi:hypothetical protein
MRGMGHDKWELGRGFDVRPSTLSLPTDRPPYMLPPGPRMLDGGGHGSQF